MKQRNASYAFAALAAIVAVGGVGVTARAQTTPYPPSPGVPVPTEPANRIPPNASPGTPGTPQTITVRVSQTPASDADFVRLLLVGNTAELDQAKYMVNRAASPIVRAYAQQMIGDHSTVAVKLQVATRGVALGEPPPRLTTPGDVRGIELLATLNGPQRDRAYMREQVGAHRRQIALMEWESQNGKVASLKALAVELLPTVSAHARMALAYQAIGSTSMAIDTFTPAGTGP